MTFALLLTAATGVWAQDTDEVAMTGSPNTWTFSMPDYNVELEPEYFDLTAPTANTADIYAGSSTALINAGETTETGATMKYAVTDTNTQPGNTDGFSADVPTAQAITGAGTYFVWYYIDFESGDDSNISATAVQVTVKAPRATIAIAPTAKDDICQGETTEQLVTAGGGGGENPEGTMMYLVTTIDTQPTTTDDFDEAVPTVGESTADTYFVWYYVKGNETHSDSEISTTAIEVTVKNPRATVRPAPTAADNIYAGETTSLVTEGTVTGGTIYYALGTDNTTIPTTEWGTERPTASTYTEACTVYVWYYVKGDESYSNSKYTASAVTVKAPRATVTTAPTAVNPIYVETEAELITGGETSQGTLMYFAQISTANAPTSTTTGWSEDVPTAESISVPGTYNVYYYIVGTDTYGDSEIFGPIAVTVLTDKYDITFNAANTNKIDATDATKGTVTVKMGEADAVDKTSDIDNNTLAAVKMNSTVTVTAATGYLFTAATATKSGETTNLATLSTDNTEATFTMPAAAANFSYTLKRNLLVQTTANIIIGEGQEAETLTANSRLRIQNTDNGYVFVKALAISFSDELENVTIDKDGFATAKLVPQFYLQQDNEQNPWAPVTDLNETTGLPNNLQPGQVYCVTFVPADELTYDGETEKSVTITLFEGYEVEVPAGEYVTYYREDYNLEVDEQFTNVAKLYTITDVNSSSATATATKITSANKEMPFLVFNSSNEAKTILLIPTETVNGQSCYTGFKGTAMAKTTSDTESYGPWNWAENTKYYGFNGADFVWINVAGNVAAHRCWLEIETVAAGARQLTLVWPDGSATRINGVNADAEDGDWYDLNGRKLQGKPQKKGIYILNGYKKVVK